MENGFDCNYCNYWLKGWVVYFVKRNKLVYAKIKCVIR